MDEIRTYTARLIWFSADTQDSEGNIISGARNETLDFKCSRGTSTASTKLTSSNFENQASFKLGADIIEGLDLSLDYKVIFEGVEHNVIKILNRKLILDMLIYVK